MPVYVGRFFPLYSCSIFSCAASQRLGSSRRYFSTAWSMAVFMYMARMIGAGPLIVIDTDVLGDDRSKPEYSFFMSSSVGTLTPELPILPKMSGRGCGSSPYSVTESNAVERRAAFCPSD